VTAAAQTWPQYGGPARDFKAARAAVATAWPSSGPREVWSRALGEGYSAVTADGAALYTLYRPVKGLFATMADRVMGTGASPEVVIALDAATGRTLWEHAYDAPIPSHLNVEYGTGPHSTPLLAGERVFAVGSTGRMHALDRRTGRVAWAQDLVALGGVVHSRGYACSPLAYGSTVVTTLGAPGQALVAFDQATGRVAWKGGAFEASPSSPLIVDVDGQPQLVFFHADGVAGLDPATGATLWSHPHRTEYGLNISVPSFGPGNVLVVSSAYSGGSRGLRLSRAGGRTTVTQLWHSNRLRVHFAPLVRLGDRVYASSGDFGPAFVTAADANTGAIAWQERGFARAGIVGIGDRLLILDEDGVLALATPRADGLTVHGRAEVLSGKAWTVPTVVGTRVYLRDRATIKALELGP
jgi:outer membrane protein assembly factor BamB